MTLGAAILALTAALLAVAAPPVAKAVGGPLGDALLWGRFPVAGLMMMFLWACLYYFLPDVEQKFRFITPGSVVGVVLWVVASWGFSVYVTNFGKYEVTYGALGGVAVMLVWMWISSQVVLLGAEINAVLEHRSPAGKDPGARRIGEKSRGKKTDPVGEARPPKVIRRPARSAPPLLTREALQDRRTRLWAAGAVLAALFKPRRRFSRA
jgi:membrane protein